MYLSFYLPIYVSIYYATTSTTTTEFSDTSSAPLFHLEINAALRDSLKFSPQFIFFRGCARGTLLGTIVLFSRFCSAAKKLLPKLCLTTLRKSQRYCTALCACQDSNGRPCPPLPNEDTAASSTSMQRMMSGYCKQSTRQVGDGNVTHALKIASSKNSSSGSLPTSFVGLKRWQHGNEIMQVGGLPNA